VIIHNFDLSGTSICPIEANPVPLIDPYAMLAFSIAT
jgi:hypothetical protein